MSLQRDVRLGFRIGRAEVVRSYRQLRQNRRRFVGLSIVVLFFSANVLLVLPRVYSLGRTIRSVSAIPAFGFVATILPVVVLGFALLRTAKRLGSIQAEELILMSVPPRAVVIGLLIAEITKQMLWLGLPVGAVVAAFAAGLKAPTLAVTVGLVGLPLLCWAAVWGYALGIGLLQLFRWIPNLKLPMNIGLILSIIPLLGGLQLVSDGALPTEKLLLWGTIDPVASYVAIVFLGTPLSQPVTNGAIGVGVFLVVTTPIGLWGATYQATSYWFTDGTFTAASRANQEVSNGFSPPPPFKWTLTGCMAWGHLLRAWRQPQEIGHVLNFLLPLAIFLGLFLPYIGNQLGTFIAGLSVVIGANFAGLAFTMNPLGDDRPQFPLLFLTQVSPKTLIRSRIFASVAVGIAMTVFGQLIAFLLGAPLLVILVFVVVGCIFCVQSAMFAVGIGSAQPAYEPKQYWGMETIVPSTIPLIGWIEIVGIGTIIGTWVIWALVTGRFPFTSITGVVLLIYGLATIGVPYWLYRYAVSRVRKYTIE